MCDFVGYAFTKNRITMKKGDHASGIPYALATWSIYYSGASTPLDEPMLETRQL